MKPPTENLFDLTDANACEERLQTLLHTSGVRIERILSTGQSSPADFWYDQPEDEWVAVLYGNAELELADGTRQHLAAGDHLLLPARTLHRVAFTENPTLWLAVFFPPAPSQQESKLSHD